MSSSSFRVALACLLATAAQAWAPLKRPLSTRRLAPIDAVAVFGGSGGVGSEVVFQQLAEGNGVTCLVRDKAKLVVPPGSGGDKAGLPMPTGANVVVGDVTRQADVDKVFEGQDVTGVVIALGGKTSDVGPTMCTDGTTCVIDACKRFGVKRISVVTSIGAGDSENQAPFVFKILMKTVMKKIFTDKNNQEKLFFGGPGKDLEFTIVRPGGLTLEKPNGIINVVDGEAGSITRADVADFCVKCVTLSDFPLLGKAVCISSDKGTSWTKDRTAKTQGAKAA